MYQQVYQIDRGVELHVSIYYLDLDNSQERHFRRDPYKTYLSRHQVEDNQKANLPSKKAASVLNKISTESLLRLYYELPNHYREIATSSCSYSFIPRGSYLDKPPHIRALLQAVDLGELQLRLFTSEVSPRVDMSALNLALQQVLLEERQEYDRIEAEYQKKSTAGKAWAHTKNIGEGFYDAGTSLVGWLSDVNDLISVQGRVRRMRDAYQKTLVQCGEVPADTCNATQRFLGNLSDNQFHDLSRVLGFDPRDVSVEQIEQAVEAVELIWENPQLRSRLTQFAKQYVAAQHSLEVSTFAGGAAFEVVLTIILAALTAGVGVAASLTAKARKLKSFKRIGDILLDYVKQMKLFKANRKGKANSKEKGRSAQVEVPENSVDSAARLDKYKRPRDEIGALSDTDKESIDKVDTFKPSGVSREDAVLYLRDNPSGREMLKSIYNADPDGKPEVLFERAVGYIQTGQELPVRVVVDKPLYKIVPEGEGVSDYSPFFTDQDGLESAKFSGKPLSDVFGLPAKSDSENYDIFKIETKGEVVAYGSTIAPTSELGGKFITDGGGRQIIVTNRGEFSSPLRIGSVKDN